MPATRIVMVQNDEWPIENHGAGDTSSQTNEPLSVLSVYRYGFSVGMAVALFSDKYGGAAHARALKLELSNMKGHLSNLSGKLGYRRGLYYISPDIRKELTRIPGVLHLQAAKVLAPYAFDLSFAGVGLDRVLQNEWIGEAEWQMTKAKEEFPVKLGRPLALLRNHIKALSWEMVVENYKGGGFDDAYLTAMELIQSDRQNNIKTTSSQYLLVGKAARQSAHLRKIHDTRRQKLFKEAFEWFDKAKAATSNQEEMLSVLTLYSVSMHEFGDEAGALEMANEAEAYWKSWFGRNKTAVFARLARVDGKHGDGG